MTTHSTAAARTILVAVTLDNSGVKAVTFVREHIVRPQDHVILAHVVPDTYPSLSPTLVGFAGEGVFTQIPECVLSLPLAEGGAALLGLSTPCTVQSKRRAAARRPRRSSAAHLCPCLMA